MNIVVLTLHDLRDFPLAEWARRTGAAHRLFVLADAETQCPGLRDAETFPDYINNGLVERRVLEIHRAHGVDAVVSFGEDDVIRAARLREKLGLRGQRVASAEAYRCKVTMKTLLRDSGLALPAFRRIASPLDLLEFVEAQGLPVYVKPTTSSGSTGGKKIATRSELETVLASELKARLPYSEYVSDMMVESFVEGELHHVDGFWNGSAMSVAVASRYLSPSLDLGAMSANVALTSVTLAEDSPLSQKLVESTEIALRTLPGGASFPFHAEFFVRGDEVTFCEIASRTGGARVAPTVAHATGIDLNETSFRAQIGVPCEIVPTPRRLAGWTLLCPSDTRVLKDPTDCPFDWVVEYKTDAKQGDHRDGRHYSGDKIASAVIAGETPEAIEERAGRFHRWFLESFTDFYERNRA